MPITHNTPAFVQVLLAVVRRGSFLAGKSTDSVGSGLVEFVEVLLFVCALTSMLSPTWGLWTGGETLPTRLRTFSSRRHIATACLAAFTFLGCVAVALALHEPVPRIHDEFSYLLMSDTLAAGRITNPSPPLPEFFETFHVLIRPVYVSKYFPAQGFFLALGQKLAGHPAVGVWLSSALGCAAMCWMLQKWVEPTWAVYGGFVMAVQLGIYSYWSQTYWGGMAAALGGALFFGAVRRLWNEFSWKASIWLALGLVILAMSRPLEGLLAVIPVSLVFIFRAFREKFWAAAPFWRSLLVPAGIVLLLGGIAIADYNRAITGSFLKPPYTLHEEQYQESPPFIFMPMRQHLVYDNPWLEQNYRLRETRLYEGQRTASGFVRITARKLATWWAFYCGVLLTAPLILPGILLSGKTRFIQIGIFAALVILGINYDPRSVLIGALMDIFALSQIVLLWSVFDDFWERLSVATLCLVVFETLFVKVAFPHYTAPTLGLILFLQIQGLKRLWHWRPQWASSAGNVNRKQRKRDARAQAEGKVLFPWRGLVVALPIVCLVSLGVRVTSRVTGWSEDPHGPDRNSLPLHDWSLRRADLERWLEEQPDPQLVFVTYSAKHDVANEWVFNRADIMNSHVIWARDLGVYKNQELLKLMSGRKVWSLQADTAVPQLAPYSTLGAGLRTAPPEESPASTPEQDALN
jgi:hypothetical protein